MVGTLSSYTRCFLYLFSSIRSESNSPLTNSLKVNIDQVDVIVEEEDTLLNVETCLYRILLLKIF